jgi:hypothetical protein
VILVPTGGTSGTNGVGGSVGTNWVKVLVLELTTPNVGPIGLFPAVT